MSHILDLNVIHLSLSRAGGDKEGFLVLGTVLLLALVHRLQKWLLRYFGDGETFLSQFAT
jgi:hypothetical protein